MPTKDELEATLEKRDAKIAELEEEVATLEGERDAVVADVAGMRDQETARDEEIAQLEAKVSELKTEIEAKDQAVEKAEKAVADAEARDEGQAAEIAELKAKIEKLRDPALHGNIADLTAPY